MCRKALFVSLLFVFISFSTALAEPTHGSTLKVCSFNIQFLGHFKDKDNRTLANILRPFDLVVVQELVAPPYSGYFPDGKPYRPDAEAADFFNQMKALGFSYFISEEDTGTGDTIHNNGSATEWWVTFYKPERVEPAKDLPRGFLAADRSNHPDYERVPFAFGFRTNTGSFDFVLISVHLQPGDSQKDKSRRKQELASIARWIDQNDSVEKDFIILGDMNIEDMSELTAALPGGYQSLNCDCTPTNTNPTSPKPYDHVLYRPENTAGELVKTYGFHVGNLIELARSSWSAAAGPYPGDPYIHDDFRKRFSDHNPIDFQMASARDDD